MSPADQTFTYRGRSLEELVPRIRRELGDDAVIVARRETTSGGVGGFFAKREIEVDVRPGDAAAGIVPPPAQPLGDDQASPAARAFAQQLAQAQQRQNVVSSADLGRPAPMPATAPEVDALPSSSDVTVDDLFPPASPAGAQGLAALFNAGLAPAPVEEPAVEAEVEAEAEPEPEPASEPEPEPEPDAEAEPEGEALAIPEPEGPITFEWPAPAREAVEEPPAAEEAPAVEQPTGMFDYVGIDPRAVEASPAEGGLAAVPAGVPTTLPPDAAAAVSHLVERGLRAELAQAVAEEALAALHPLLPAADPRDLVLEAMARRIPMHPLRRGPGVVGFVGPAGAGRTRCVARLAAAHARHGAMPVMVVALRSPDGGAELTRLLAPYGVTLHAVDTGAEGAGRIASLRGEHLVIVDTPGVSPRSSAELRSLRLELDALAPDELHLTVSATVGPAAARELVRGVRELGVGALAVTHVDETEMLGTVIGLAVDCSLPMSFLARGQAVDAGLSPASARELAQELLT